MERLVLERIIREEVELMGEDFRDKFNDLKAKYVQGKKEKAAQAAQGGKQPKEFYKAGPFAGHAKDSLSFREYYKLGQYETMLDQGYSQGAAMKKLFGDKPPEPSKKAATPQTPESEPKAEVEPEEGSREDLFGPEDDSEPTSAADLESAENDEDFDWEPFGAEED
tara:strand:- start:114 stop:611 length:498 start_codon:yes stop_codon:yes gene_type:complete